MLLTCILLITLYSDINKHISCLTKRIKKGAKSKRKTQSPPGQNAIMARPDQVKNELMEIDLLPDQQVVVSTLREEGNLTQDSSQSEEVKCKETAIVECVVDSDVNLVMSTSDARENLTDSKEKDTKRVVWGFTRTRCILAFVAIVATLALIIGLGVGLTRNTSESQSSSVGTPAPPLAPSLAPSTQLLDMGMSTTLRPSSAIKTPPTSHPSSMPPLPPFSASLTTPWLQVGQDIVGSRPGDLFGSTVSLSADGTRIAVGTGSHDSGERIQDNGLV